MADKNPSKTAKPKTEKTAADKRKDFGTRANRALGNLERASRLLAKLSKTRDDASKTQAEAFDAALSAAFARLEAARKGGAAKANAVPLE